MRFLDGTPARVRLVGGGVVVVLALICACGGLVSALANANGPDTQDMHPVVVTAGGIAGLLLAGWGVYASVKGYRYRWIVRYHGEPVMATIQARDSRLDSDGDVRWQVRVTGQTIAGDSFDRWLSTGYRKPDEVGGYVEVLYHPRLRRIALVEPGVRGMINKIMVGLFNFGVLVTMLYLIYLIGYLLLQVWT